MKYLIIFLRQNKNLSNLFGEFLSKQNVKIIENELICLIQTNDDNEMIIAELLVLFLLYMFK